MKEEEAKTVIKEYLYNHRFGYIAKDAEFDRLYEAMKVAVQALEQEPKYCDRNICLRNEYNGICCDECAVTKSKEPSGDAVSRQAILDAFADYVGSGMSMNDFDALWDIVLKAPSVKQQERMGHWIYWYTNGFGRRIYKCSKCNWDGDTAGYNFCPNCGAKMFEPQEREESNDTNK